MKKIFWGAVLLAAVLLTGCRSGTEGQSGTVTETFSDTNAESSAKTETSAATTSVETTAEVTEKPAPDVYSENVKAWAETFAGLVYAELENNKTAETPTELYPASSLETSEEALFNAAFNADIFFIDTDFDGVPELFAGGRGITGTGSYTVYTADGVSYGNGLFAHYFDAYCIADGCMFAHSGSTGFDGWTKLCDGLPTIFCNGLLSDEKTNNMTLRYSDGRVQDFNGLTYDEAMDMYRKYLNVEYEKLKFADDPENVPFAYARGVLKVPDPENYTEEDIYNCLAELLAEYEKAAGTDSAEASAAAKLEYPEPVLPPEAVKIDVGSGFNGEKYNFDYKVLDGDNVLVLYTSEIGGKVSARAKIFGLSDGAEKADIDIPATEADTFFVLGRAYPYLDNENILCQIYGCYWDEDMYIERTCTAVNDDLSYSTEYTRSGFWDNAYCRLPDGRSITITDYGNIYEITEDGSREILLNAVFEGWYSKGNIMYHYYFPIDENRFVYNRSGWEWIWGIGVYDFRTRKATDIPNTSDFFPIGFHGGKIYSVCSSEGYTENVIYASDINTLETKPLFELDENDMPDAYKMTPDGSLIIKGDNELVGDIRLNNAFNVFVYDPDTLALLRKYEFKNVYVNWWEMNIIDSGRAVLPDRKQKCLYILGLDG